MSPGRIQSRTAPWWRRWLGAGAQEPNPSDEPVRSSRTDREAAGWRDDGRKHFDARWEELLTQRRRTRWGNFTWISPRPLLASINDQVAKGLDDLINSMRPRWVAQVRGDAHVTENFLVEEGGGSDGRLSFLILGDPGEQDASQYAVVAPLLKVGGEAGFMVIASDVIYPAGDINDYVDGFYLPYRDFAGRIYGIPGNHDWYDGLNGFMYHFCGAGPLPPIKYRAGGYTWKERLARALWRKPSPPDLPALLRARGERHAQAVGGDGDDGDGSGPVVQPGPYFAIDTPELLVVCIDTGITGKLDREQGEWLQRISCRPKAKLLVTGKPIYVDGEYRPGEIDWGSDAGEAHETVDGIVCEPAHRYVGVIGGDVHNYQRYRVTRNLPPQPCNEEGGERAQWVGSDAGPGEARRPDVALSAGGQTGAERSEMHYFVCGGGGAYMSATHRFGRVDLNRENETRLPAGTEPITESEFRCYPLRGDSLARLTRRFAPMLGLALIVAIAVVALAAVAFFSWMDGFDQEITVEGHMVLAWQALLVIVTTPLSAGVLVGLSVWASKRVTPAGYRTMAATTLAAALGTLAVWGTWQLVDSVAGEWIWRFAVISLVVVLVPPLLLLGYYLLRDFVPAAVRLGIVLAVPIAVAACWIGAEQFDSPSSQEIVLLVGASLFLLWLGVSLVGRARAPGLERERTKLRVRLARVLPALVSLSAAAVALYWLAEKGWVLTALAWGLAAVVSVLALTLIVLGFRGLRALLWLFPGTIDPDLTSRWLGDRLGIEPTRETARKARPKWFRWASLKTRALASLTYRSWPFTRIMGELAEATRPPFFKSFMRADVHDGKLVLTAYGVSGQGEDEAAPTVEDRIEINLSR